LDDHGPVTTTSAPRTARDRARAELTSEIKAVGLRHLAEHGAAGLSLRAVARDLGMVSSAVYRYFPSRDDLLTALIIDAYSAVGEVAEATADVKRRARFASRWVAVAESVRTWALAHRHEYALIYGTPVTGYAAPTDTIDPASRIALVFLQLIADGLAAGEIAPTPDTPATRAVHADFDGMRASTGLDIPDEVLSRTLIAWAQLLGGINLEMFGHLHNVITDYDAFFAFQARRIAEFLAAG
jgi:AcrR family transcriptional regulator